jgi:RNA polymerase sigma factor (sigma-70 family)
MADGQWNTVVRFLRGVADAGRAEEGTDGQLLERFLAQRDGEAFAALVRRHAGVVLGVCHRILPVIQDAEDAFQATFLLLAKQAGTIGRRESVGSWLHGVARRVSLRARAGIARRRERERQAEPPAPADTSSEVVRRDLAAVLDEEVRRLPERCRAPFVLCYLEGRTNEEAARLLGCPKGTVLSRLARARELLRGRLVRRGLGLSGGVAATLLETTAAPASVPAALLGETIRAVLASTAGNGAAGGGLSASAVTLAEGVIQAMKIAKLKMWAVVVLLIAGTVGGGVGWLAYGAGGAEPPAKAEPPRDAKSAEGIADLHKARLALAQKGYEAAWKNLRQTKRFGNTLVQVGKPEDVYHWSIRWLQAERETSRKPADTLAALEDHLERMTALKEAVEGLTRDLLPRGEELNAEWYRLEARLWLAEAKAAENHGPPAPKPPEPEKP